MVTNRATADSYDVLPCDRVITIPQYIGTCWFNALLMAVFYSEAVRDAVIAARDSRWRRLQQSPNAFTRRLAEYFEHMLRLYKRPKDEGAYKFYHKVTPEKILYYLHKSDPKHFEHDTIVRNARGKYVEKPGTTAGYTAHMYAHKFLNFLQIPTVSFTAVAVDSENRYGPFRLAIGDNYSRSAVKFDAKGDYDYSYTVQSPQTVQAVLRSNPQILVVSIGQQDSFKYYAKKVKKRPDFYFLPGEHKNLPQFIRLGRSTYVLDSCVFANNNNGEKVRTDKGIKKVGGHAIAAVTCSRRRFIYSGWTAKTRDAARTTGGSAATADRPCPLMPFDWTRISTDFYITSKVCRVLRAPPTQASMRFNALRGPRVYMYVRRDLVHYKRHAIQRLKNAAKSGDKARAVRLGFSVAKQTVADALRRKARIDRAARPAATAPPTRRDRRR
jgi:hypothetical protein